MSKSKPKLKWDIDFDDLIGAEIKVKMADGLDAEGVLNSVEWQDVEYIDADGTAKIAIPKILHIGPDFSAPIKRVVSIEVGKRVGAHTTNPDHELSPEEQSRLPRHRQPQGNPDIVRKKAAQAEALRVRKKQEKLEADRADGKAPRRPPSRGAPRNAAAK